MWMVMFSRQEAGLLPLDRFQKMDVKLIAVIGIAQGLGRVLVQADTVSLAEYNSSICSR